MEDLGGALVGEDDVLMLGGGNPAHIPQVEELLRDRLLHVAQSEKRFGEALGDYDPPQGNRAMIEALSRLLRERFGWPIGPKNIALTNGSQSAFFSLFNLFGGTSESGRKRRILLPLTPEYIGYSDLGLEPDMLISARPRIELLGNHLFKYHLDLAGLKDLMDDSIGAICVSRPTNPTGNVLTDFEVEQLTDLTRSRGIPFILDNAYGLPFPGIVFVDAATHWQEHMIVCMSLSKLGLPAVRTGIVVANEEIVRMIARINAITGLAPGGVGAALVLDLIESGEIVDLSEKWIKPFYQSRAEQAVEKLADALEGVNFRIHTPEGAFFLWLWLPDLPISARELYEALKKRKVIVVPGEYFFPGAQSPWEHAQQCIRISYAQPTEVVDQGLEIVAEEVKAVISKGRNR
jgi:valine--pyruvate aminotransferase